MYDFGWGNEVGFMRLPKLSFEQLFYLLEHSKLDSNKYGAAHIILVDHPHELLNCLLYKLNATRLVETVVQVFQHYGLDDYTSIHAVRGFRSMVHGFISLERNEGFKMPISVDDSYRFLIDTFLLGLHSKMQAAQSAGGLE